MPEQSCGGAGFACTLGCWGPQLDDLLRAGEKGRPAVRALVLDNRGVGRSSARLRRRAYSTTLMAQDILALLVRAPADLPSLSQRLSLVHCSSVWHSPSGLNFCCCCK